MFHESMSRDHEDELATGQPQGIGSEAYLSGTSQEAIPEDAQKEAIFMVRLRRIHETSGLEGQARLGPPVLGRVLLRICR